MIRVFESNPSLHTNSLAFSEYVKALVRVGRLSESEFLNSLLRGNYLTRIAHFLLTVSEQESHTFIFVAMMQAFNHNYDTSFDLLFSDRNKYNFIKLAFHGCVKSINLQL